MSERYGAALQLNKNHYAVRRCVSGQRNAVGTAPGVGFTYHSAHLLLCMLTIGCSLPVLAQDNGPASVKVGEADLTPIIRLDYVTNSNAFLRPENETEATGFIVSPEVVLRAERRLFLVELGYSGEFAGYSEDVLDYDDHRLTARASAELSSKHRVSASLSVSDEHDALGTGLTLLQNNADSEQVESLNTEFNAQYVFGALAARGNVLGGLFVKNESFQNRPDITSGSDYNLIAPYGRFSYRVSSDTRAFAELRYRQYDFDSDSRDRSEIVTSLGLSFSQTGKTGGEARVGITQANYEDDSIDDPTLFSADVDIFYQPSSVSRFEARISRALNDVDAGAGFTSDAIDDDVLLVWSYDWSGFVSTRTILGAEIRNRDCEGLGTETATVGFELGLKPRRWIEIGAGVRYSQRGDDNCTTEDGNVIDLDYERQTINVFLKATL